MLLNPSDLLIQVLIIVISEITSVIGILTIITLRTKNNPRRLTHNKQRIDWATVLMVSILLALIGLTVVLCLGEVLAAMPTQ